jgi:hypothetical protein
VTKICVRVLKESEISRYVETNCPVAPQKIAAVNLVGRNSRAIRTNTFSILNSQKPVARIFAQPVAWSQNLELFAFNPQHDHKISNFLRSARGLIAKSQTFCVQPAT